MYTKFIYVYKKFVCVRIHAYILIKNRKKLKRYKRKKKETKRYGRKKQKKKKLYEETVEKKNAFCATLLSARDKCPVARGTHATCREMAISARDSIAPILASMHPYRLQWHALFFFRNDD